MNLQSNDSSIDSSLPERVAIVGGTHGNELTGIYLVRHWQKHPDEIQRPALNTQTLVANPEAHQQMKRYLDYDLNRCFASDDLSDPGKNSREHRRAREINALLGPKNSPDPAAEFIIDLHTTTANMGLTLVVETHHLLSLQCAAYVQKQMPEAVIFYDDIPRNEHNFLVSIANKGHLLIEVGPVPQGLLRADIFEQTRQATRHALDFLQQLHDHQSPDLPDTINAFRFLRKLHLPRHPDGSLAGMIHPERQDQDWQPIQPGDPLFLTFEGDTISWQENRTVYGAFINEAAYYDQLHGLSLMDTVTIPLT